MLFLCSSGCHQQNAAERVSASPETGTSEVSRVASVPTWIDLKPGLRCSRATRSVMFKAEICLDEGWLEQLVCSVGTREHESIMSTTVAASSIHAAMLAVGLESGRPGQWVDGFLPPEGSEIEILVGTSGDLVYVPVREWVVSTDGRMPLRPWVFAGSRMRSPQEVPEGYSLYEADTSGSIVGLVTFGDELLGYQEVIPDQVEVAPEEWKALTDLIPPVGTKVWVLIRPTEN